ncbi:MAG: gliding motility-associated ABC transporter substrate-binding protein GldG [Lewinellaceae bacterium]|nr:gliding motility-associated ABC transporter substrate-binding protein GldG [Lewinellaceae bacterium]
MSKNSKRNQSITQLVLLTGILIFLNVLGNFFFTQFDLTEENRYTLTKPTIDLLHNLDGPVFVRVLLEGEFPAGFKRLQRSTREMLDDFRGEAQPRRDSTEGMLSYWARVFSSKSFIQYEFSDPNAGTLEEINQRREEFRKEGLVPTLFRLKDVEGTEEKFIYPYAIFSYKGRQVTVNLLENQPGYSQDEVLGNSINMLEYKFASAIQKLQLEQKQVIAFAAGQGEPGDQYTRDLINELRPYYDFGRFFLDSSYIIPPQIDLLIVAKPTQPFTEQDKFKIDQYVMNGGKVLFLLDRLEAELDSLRESSNFVTREYPINLDDLLFHYGVRIEPNLVLDLQCSKIPQVVGSQGGNPQIELFNWYYDPVVTPQIDHPILKGLENVNLFFPNSIDTVRTKTPIKKTVLLASSNYSREQFHPTRLNFEILRYDPDPTKFTKQHIPMAVLLEGEFPSLYANRVTEEMKDGLEQLGASFKEQSPPNRMVVVSDGDVILNPVTRDGGTMPLGFNVFERRMYGNKDFIINTIEYLLQGNGLIEARGKEIELRPIDTVRASDYQRRWQVLNIGVPLLTVFLFGVVYFFLRRRRYTH